MISPLLRRREFRMFWIGQSVSLLGDQISLFAIPIAAVLLLHAPVAQMGLLTAAGLLPSLLLSLPAGGWVDRLGRGRQLMLACDLGRAAALLGVPVAYLLGGLTMPLLYTVALLVGTLDVLFGVAYQMVFVALVDRDDYVPGQALLNGSRAASFVAGQSLAGLLVALVTAPGALLIDCASFLVSACCLGRIRPDEPPAAPREAGHLRAGLRFIRESATIRACLAATTTVNLFTFAFSAIFVVYAVRELGNSPAVLGLVLGAGAVGGLLGSTAATRLSRRIGTGPVAAAGCVLFPAPLVLVPLAAGPHWLVLGCLFAAEFGSGFGVMLLDIGLGALFATEIPDGLRARTAGAYRMVNYGIRPLGALLGGGLGTVLGLRPTLLVAAIGASTCVLWLVGTPVLRRYPRAHVAGAAGGGRCRDSHRPHARAA
jgi:MFS family permease